MGLMQKVAPPTGDVLNGRFVPGGTQIGYYACIHRNSDVFGIDAELFRLERWLEAGGEFEHESNFRYRFKSWPLRVSRQNGGIDRSEQGYCKGKCALASIRRQREPY